MSIDWPQLIELRERRRRIALAAMQADQRIAERSRATAKQAQRECERRVAAKTDHWEATRDSLARGGNVAQLGAAAAWSGALQAQIAQGDGLLHEAQAIAQAHEQTLALSRAKLRAAAAGIEKAARMHQRETAQRRRVDEARSELAAESHAALVWSVQRAS